MSAADDAPVRVLLVDDQALLRAGIATILGTQPGIVVVGEAGTGREAVAAARELDPDVICMDVQMPDMDGLEATRRIVADPDVRAAILMLTTFNREDYLLQALRAGASGFLLKNSRPEHLVDAIRALAAGEALLAPEVTRAVIARAVAAEGGPGAPPPEAEGRTRGRAGRAGCPTPPRAPAPTPAPIRWPPSPTARSRCSASSRAACRTTRSRRSSCSAAPL